MHELVRHFERPGWTDEERRNVDVVVRAVAGMNEDDDDVTDLFGEEVTGHFLGAGAEPTVWTSDRAGWVEYRREHRAAFPDWHVDVEQILAADDTVVVQATVSGTLSKAYQGMMPTGESFTVPAFYLFRLEDGKILEQKSLSNTLGMLQQLGLFPDSPGKMAKLVLKQVRRKLPGGKPF